MLVALSRRGLVSFPAVMAYTRVIPDMTVKRVFFS